ncbi:MULTISPECIES: phage tail length tape measure protein [Acinetobacter]|uniref:phage tail length tape measure protein n=1 Tax=Acinetobacter TaxID=469 RepID=UPI00044D5F56|nr:MULTISPECIES: phage tail length tape measure protein [Acinetobacter]EXH09694.1 putative bacteriophage tail protein gpT [Acinetobacter sp. 1245593]EXI12118.1 putative bacteriophage tail protein gpT [Acinetobacter sp. 694762]MCE6433595.1 phage tail tape measure protein [Acinetobacter baumannii]OIG56702.1 phage tail tape measure protein [Acinetobacter nosocomialis]OIG56988.1 phage tail tape measure protein [Acinetobacter nosocomialis]
MKPLKLEVLFGSKDSLSPALKLMIGSSNAASKALKNTRDELKRLNDQQRQLDSFKKLKEDVKQASTELERNKKIVQSLREQLAVNPDAKLTKELKKAETQVKQLTKVVTEGRPRLIELRNELNNAGLKSKNFADQQQELKEKINAANTSIDSQKNKLENLNRFQKSHSKMTGNVRTAAMYGAGMAATGTAALYQMRKPIDESKRVDVEENRIASLGFGKKATDEAIQYAKAMKTFGTSTLDNLTLVRDGVTAFGDVHHAQWVAPTLAKMKFANEAMYGDHGVENEKKFMDMLKVIEMRNGLKSKESFQEQANIIQQVITATGGRVQAEEWLNVIKTGGIAAKGMDNKAFYYKMEPLVQEMGGHRVGTSMMSAYQNLYQGRTTQRAAANLDKFGLIGDYSKVKHNKTGDLSYLDIGAIKGADLFKKDQFAWMEQVLVPALNAKGITKEGDVIDAIGSVFSNRTASNLFAQMYMQRDQIHKNAKLNEGAFNIDQLNTQAQGTTSGKELEARAKLNDAYLQFGQTILPIYTQALVMASNALQGFTGWMQQNPTLAKALGTGLLLIAGGLVAIGGLLLIFSPLILSMLSLRLMMVTLGVQGSALSFVFKMLTSPFKALGSSVMWLGRMLFAAGQLMRANPIILAVTLLATAAYFIYQNWAPIKSFFMDLWTGVKNAFNTGVSFIKGIIQSVDQVFADNPLLNLLFPLIGIPRLIIANWSGITGFFSSVWTSITTGVANVWNSIVSYLGPIGDWFAAKWENIKLVTSVVWSGIKSVVTTAWDNLISAITNSPLFQRIVDGWTKIFDYLGSLKNKMLSIGKNIIDGLVNGIQSGFDSLKTIWAKINSYMPSFMKQKMDIHSPSRVMAGLGGHIVGGIGMGLTQAFPELKNKYNQVLNLFTNKAQSPAMDQIDIAAPVISKIQTAPNLTSSRQSSLAVAGDTYTIHIHAAPGQMVQDLERQIEQVINRLQRDKLSRVRTIMADQE